jgi:hypothetical protein
MTTKTIPQGKSTSDIQAELNTRLHRLESLLKMSLSEHGIESFESLDMGQKLAITGSFIESVTKCLELSDSIESA